MPKILVTVDGQQHTIDYDTIKDLYTNPILEKAYREFSIKEHTIENLDFMLAVEKIRNNKKATIDKEPDNITYQKMVMDQLSSLYQQFVKKGAVQEINLPSQTIHDITETITQYNQSTDQNKFFSDHQNFNKIYTFFEKAQHQIHALIIGDSFGGRFIKDSKTAYTKNQVIQKDFLKEMQHASQALSILIGDPMSQDPIKGGLTTYINNKNNHSKNNINTDKNENSILFTFFAHQKKKFNNAEDLQQKAIILQTRLFAIQANFGSDPKTALKAIENVNKEIKEIITLGIENDKKAHGIFSRAGQLRTIMQNALKALSVFQSNTQSKILPKYSKKPKS